MATAAAAANAAVAATASTAATAATATAAVAAATAARSEQNRPQRPPRRRPRRTSRRKSVGRAHLSRIYGRQRRQHCDGAKASAPCSISRRDGSTGARGGVEADEPLAIAAYAAAAAIAAPFRPS